MPLQQLKELKMQQPQETRRGKKVEVQNGQEQVESKSATSMALQARQTCKIEARHHFLKQRTKQLG